MPNNVACMLFECGSNNNCYILFIFHCLFENIPVAESHLFTDGLFWAMLERYVKLGCILSTLIKS